jgi:hypothetical protein
MKQLLICLTLSLLATFLHAQDYGLYWKYKDYDGAIAVTVPRWAIHTGSWFLKEKTDRRLLRKVRKARVLVFENASNPVSELEMRHFQKKAQRRNLEEMLVVRDQGTRVLVMAKERRKAIRKVVVLVREPETFALVSVRGKLRFEEIGQLLREIPKEWGDKDGEDVKPLLPENVRSVIRI